MPFDARVLKVLIASPGDTKPLRDLVERSLHDWNGMHAEKRGVVLLPRRWETGVVPVVGRGLDGQGVINRQLVDDSDIVIGVFHSRLGSPTARAIAGTVEELERGQAAGRPVHVWFAQMPHPHDVDHDQLRQLGEFKRQLADKGLYGSFDDPDDLRRRVLAAVEMDVQWLDGPGLSSAAPILATAEPVLPVDVAEEPDGAAAQSTNDRRQEFFAEVLAGAAAQHPLIRVPARGSRSWINFSRGPFGVWGVSVAQSGRLRVEAYLSGGTAEENKRRYDRIHGGRSQWEREIGQALSWERLDDRVASRIASYSPEVLDLDDPQRRSATRAWAVDTLVRMHRVLDPELRAEEPEDAEAAHGVPG